MTKPSLILIGAGGHAHSCIDVIEQQGHFQIAGFVGLPEQQHTQHLGYAVIGADTDLPALAKNYQYALIAIGQIHSAEHRIRLYKLAKHLGFKLPAIISPRAYVSKHAKIGNGTIVMHDALINSGAIVGDNCIINTKSLIEHDAVIENNCHISTGAIINGGAIVKQGSFVGSNAVTKESVKTHEEDFIKAGSLFKGYANE
jgi:sugar O-acyltransferase (sialic acid O-acetyltransferase NeuD family)